MTAWSWCEVFLPQGMSLSESTAVTRVLVGRPRFGLLGLQPLVVFELWLYRGRVRWLVGMDERIASVLPAEFQAQCPGLVIVPVEDPRRPIPVTGRELRFRSLAWPMRLDVAEGVTAALVRHHADLRKDEAVVLQWCVGPSQVRTDYPARQRPLDVLGFTEPPEPDASDQQAWRRKLTEPLYGVRGRVGAYADGPRRAAGLTRPVFSALQLANVAHARVQTSPQSSQIAGQITRIMGRARTWSSTINAAELAVLIGWNVGDTAVPGQRGSFAPPPPVLCTPASGKQSGIRTLGTSAHAASKAATVSLPWPSYSANMLVIGPTGVGKSTLLARWALDEAAAGRSVIVIEPKGDLVRDILARLPQHRHDDVVVIDPGISDGTAVTGINPLAGPRQDAERRADSLLHVFRELFGSAIGARSADTLLHSLILAARLQDGTLTDVLPILTMPGFRRRVVQQVGDPLVIGPWVQWFDGLSEQQRGQIVAPVANKLRAVSARPNLRHLFAQPQPKFALDDVFARPRVVLVNVNSGAVGPEAAAMISSILLNQLWEGIQRQMTRPAVQRRPVSLIVDEWQTATAGLDFADVLARSRGARTSFTLANQNLDQLSPTLRAAALANARSRVIFRPAEGDGRALAAVLGENVTTEDLSGLPAYRAVARVLVDARPSDAFEVATPALGPLSTDPDALRRVSIARYGRDPQELDNAILERWQGEQPPPDLPIGIRRKQP
ncbi:type IV secretory system conjugative DNA transfer family protein [Amycolatopsis sp.]|uniref:type IV secretory system conjugative DNA transfer family protein n=1 Tax=Amycolatopsis sp. TaxID=37632 RepID=UPI002BAA9BA1|nr:type IV secretory system conjugative DNA transfer family protein [Amycolatopsis sp.]HVV12458.1 type IV secretory system conjugative DNA transfer family protein [Amycolatopsis sp.]